MKYNNICIFLHHIINFEGNCMKNVLPVFPSLSTEIVPPSFSTMPFDIARPSPVPPIDLLSDVSI